MANLLNQLGTNDNIIITSPVPEIVQSVDQRATDIIEMENKLSALSVPAPPPGDAPIYRPPPVKRIGNAIPKRYKVDLINDIKALEAKLGVPPKGISGWNINSLSEYLNELKVLDGTLPAAGYIVPPPEPPKSHTELVNERKIEMRTVATIPTSSTINRATMEVGCNTIHAFNFLTASLMEIGCRLTEDRHNKNIDGLAQDVYNNKQQLMPYYEDIHKLYGPQIEQYVGPVSALAAHMVAMASGKVEQNEKKKLALLSQSQEQSQSSMNTPRRH